MDLNVPPSEELMDLNVPPSEELVDGFYPSLKTTGSPKDEDEE